MNKVVVRYRDGRAVKGMAMDLDPNKPSFHLRPQAGGRPVEIKLEDLKAVFFVRTFEGSPQKPASAIDPDDPRGRGATAASFTFEDGETILGFSMHYPPTKAFFYIVPADANSNNMRILINRSAVGDMRAFT